METPLETKSAEVIESSNARSPSTTPRKVTPKMALKLVGFVIAGAALGYAYHRFVGCRTGTCPITANPYISTIYGAVLGYLFSGAIK